ncbi:MAG: BspA family leucine-rich repeat surface protein [Marinicella sp.]
MKFIAVLFLLLTPFSIVKAADGFVTTWEITNPNSTTVTIGALGPPFSAFYAYRVDWEDDGVIDTPILTGEITHDYQAVGEYTIRIIGSYPGLNIPYSDRKKIIEVNQWGNGRWRTMNNAFHGTDNLSILATDAPDLSLVTDMSNMFNGSGIGAVDLSSWDTSNVTNMSNMFINTLAANPDVSTWNTSAVTNMSNMFANTLAANPDVSTWNTSAVTNMGNMFANTQVANPDVSGWVTSSVLNMASMFSSAEVARPVTTHVPDSGIWDTSKVTQMDFMFNAALMADPDVADWDVSNVTRMNQMFMDTRNANPDVSIWNTSSLIYTNSMFGNAQAAFPDVSDWNTSSLEQAVSMFGYSPADPDVSGWDVRNLKNAWKMFSNAIMAQPDLSAWVIPNLDDMEQMLEGVTLPTALYDQILINFANQITSSDVRFHAGDSHYCIGANAKSIMEGRGWIFTDAGIECQPNSPVITSPAFGATINDNRPVITGTSDLFTIVTVSGPLGQSSCSASVSSTGIWSCQLNSPLADGINVLSAVAQDTANNDSPVTTHNINVQTGQAYELNVTAPSELLTSEAGDTDSFSVSLSLAPTDDVSFNVTSDDTGEGVPSVSSVTFTPSNWNTAQTIVVTGVDDAVIDGDQSYQIILSTLISNDAGYAGINPDDLSAVNIDDDVDRDLSATISNCISGVNPGQVIQYELRLQNLGTEDIVGATVTSDFTAGLSTPSWLCEAFDGASCGDEGGSTDLVQPVDLPVASSIVYTFFTSVVGAELDFVEPSAYIQMPSGQSDGNLDNNTAIDSDLIYSYLFKASFECTSPSTPQQSTDALLQMISM